MRTSRAQYSLGSHGPASPGPFLRSGYSSPMSMAPSLGCRFDCGFMGFLLVWGSDGNADRSSRSSPRIAREPPLLKNESRHLARGCSLALARCRSGEAIGARMRAATSAAGSGALDAWPRPRQRVVGLAASAPFILAADTILVTHSAATIRPTTIEGYRRRNRQDRPRTTPASPVSMGMPP